MPNRLTRSDGVKPNFARLQRHKSIALAVSGGPDSIALMHLANEWRDNLTIQVPELMVLTVDHGLREESENEAVWVKGEAHKLGLLHETLRWKGEKPRENIQELAREARYQLMLSHCNRHGIQALLTAHTLDDQAETFLMRLARGSGVDGLSAIGKVVKWSNIEVCRPLLSVSKSELIDYLRLRNLPWIEDPSNENEFFERVRMRKLVPELEKLGLTSEAIGLAATRIGRAREALDFSTSRFLETAVEVSDAGFCQLKLKDLQGEAEEIGIRTLSRILEAVGGRASPPQLSKLEQLYDALIRAQNGTQTLARCRLDCNAGLLTISRELRGTDTLEVVLDPGEHAIWDHRFRIFVPPSIDGPVSVRALSEEGFQTLRVALDEDPGIPFGARASLVSFWRNRQIVCVPHLGYYAQKYKKYRRRGPSGFTAEFINKDLSEFSNHRLFSRI